MKRHNLRVYQSGQFLRFGLVVVLLVSSFSWSFLTIKPSLAQSATPSTTTPTTPTQSLILPPFFLNPGTPKTGIPNKSNKPGTLPVKSFNHRFLQPQSGLSSSDGAANDYFGQAISLSGDSNTLLVGAYNKTVAGNTLQGAAYIFTRVNSVSPWTQQAELTALDGTVNDAFGGLVSLSADGNTALIGAPYKNQGSNTKQGAAYIFVRSGSTWSQQAKLLSTDAATNDYFGSSVTLSGNGNIALIGAASKTINSRPAEGEAYFFVRSGTSWVQQTSMYLSDGAYGDFYGGAVSLSNDGNTAFIAAFGRVLGSTPYDTKGAVYVYTNTGSSWTPQARISAYDTYLASGSEFGSSLAQSNDGHTLLIGAPFDYGNDGAVYIYVGSGSTWNYQAKFRGSDTGSGDTLGTAVALSADGNSALIGAYRKTINGHATAGEAYLFQRSGTNWNQQQSFVAPTPADNAAFGVSLALNNDGQYALIGAYGQAVGSNSGQGIVYPYVGLMPSTTALTSTPNPSIVGQSVTFTATTTPISATGSVNFTFDNSTIVSATLSGGSATYVTNTLTAGSHSVTATYNGDTTFSGSSNTITHIVNRYSSSITLTNNPNPSTQAQSVVFTATTIPITATGTVTFSNGASVLGTAPLVNGSAVFTTSTLPTGNQAVTATYSGDATFDISSATITQTVTGLNLTSSPNPSVIGWKVTFSASVIPVAATGTVTFTEGTLVLGTAPLVNGTAVITNSSLSIGSHVITATYSGDVTYPGVISQAITQVVTPYQPFIVTSPTDDGTGLTYGTLSYALSQPISGSNPITITFALPQGNNTITFSASMTTTAKVQAHVIIYGGAFGSSTRVIIDGNGVSGDGLHLVSQNYLYNLTIKHFGGRELVLEGTGNHMEGVVVIAS